MLLIGFSVMRCLSKIDITSDEFWKKFEGLLEEFHQRNKDLLAKRSLLTRSNQ